MRSMIFSLIPILLTGVFAQDSTSSGIPLCPLKSPDFKDPDHMVRPKYPKQALKDGTAGTLRLRAVVDTNGKTKNLTVLSGPAIFEKPTLDAVRKWHFYPVLVKDQSVAATYIVDMRFNLTLQAAIPEVTLDSPRPPEPSLPWNNDSFATPDGTIIMGSPAGIIGPKATYQIDPEFSEEARKEKQAGSTMIRLVVGTDGLPRDLRLRCGAEAGLNEKALDAVKRWKFTPGTKDGKPVPVEIEVEVEFKLYN